MRVAWKLAIGVAAVIVSITMLNACSRIQREAELFDDELHRDTRMLGRALGVAGRQLAEGGDAASAARLISTAISANEALDARWVWLDAPTGHPDRAVVPPSLLGRFDHDSHDRTWFWDAGSGLALHFYTALDLGGRRGAIEVTETVEAEAEYLDDTILRTVVTTGVQLGLAVTLVLGMTSLLVGRPVARLVARTRAIAIGDLAPGPRSRQRDEIGQLAREIEDTAAQLRSTREKLEEETASRIAALEQLRHADRLVTVGQLGAGIAHELGTPLGIIIGHAQMTMEDHPAPAPAHAHAEVIANQARRATTIIRQLLDFARRRAPDRIEVELRGLIQQTLAMLTPLAAKRRVQLVLSEGPATTASVDPGQIQQAIANLVVNAIDATSDGVIEVGVERGLSTPPDHRPPRACVSITVRDTGSGMPPEVLERIFEPFFTTKGPGHGTGLGLAVAHGFAADHGGWLTVSSRPGEGSTFVFAIPEAA